MRRGRKFLIGAGMAAAMALGAAGSASAATVGIDSSGVLRYTGAAAEATHLRLYFDPVHFVYLLEDTGAASTTITGKWCQRYTSQITYCTWGRFNSVDVQLGGGGAYAADELALTRVTITGGAGDDTMIGGGGPVTLVASGGTDTLTAGAGTTEMSVADGSAVMTGGSGRSDYHGGPAADVINARNGVAEQVECGAGVDTVDADTDDTLAADCEAATRGEAVTAPEEPTPAPSVPAAPLTGLPATPVLPAPVAIPRGQVALDTHGRIGVPISCPASSAVGCEGVLTVTMPRHATHSHEAMAARRRVIGRSKRFHLRAGRKKVITVQLQRRAARVFRRAKRHKRKKRAHKLVVTAAVRTEAGIRKVTRTVTVRERRRPTRVKRR